MQDSENLFEYENAFVVEATRVDIHPKYVTRDFTNDLAIVTTSKAFFIGDTVHLPSRSTAIRDIGIISGYGRLYQVSSYIYKRILIF